MKIAVEGKLSELTEGELAVLLDRRPMDEAGLRERVSAIIERVRDSGDTALFEMARELDGVTLSSLEVPRERWAAALASMDPEERAGWERAARNIRAFHVAQIPPEVTIEVEPGVRLGRRSTPLGAVGVYAPGGRAAYPSSVLMGAVPARAVGVREVIVCSPPGPSGEPPSSVLAACEIAGATRLFAVGGVGAIAALAYGTSSIRRVDAVVGPGNRWVTEAKRQVAGTLRVDSPAGPSEVLVVADGSVDPERVAAELVAQAEHDPEAAVAVVCWDEGLLRAVRAALERLVEETPRRDIVEAALASRGGCVLAANRKAALDFAERYASEHLALFTSDPTADLGTQTTAGTVFLGDSASVAFGDYLSGANHVLPTAGQARSFSGLSALDFLRFFTWQAIDPGGAAGLAPTVEGLARAEGLPAHAAAARARRSVATRGVPRGGPSEPSEGVP